jgi:hypothetical protein
LTPMLKLCCYWPTKRHDSKPFLMISKIKHECRIRYWERCLGNSAAWALAFLEAVDSSANCKKDSNTPKKDDSELPVPWGTSLTTLNTYPKTWPAIWHTCQNWYLTTLLLLDHTMLLEQEWEESGYQQLRIRP